MELELRQIEYNSWISFIFLTCISAIAISRWLSSYRISDLLSSFYKDRFIKITRNSDKNLSLLVVTSVIIYTIQIALLIYLWLQESGDKYQGFISYLIVLTVLSVFLLSKHYIGKLVAEICGFQDELHIVEHHRNIYRAMLAYMLLFINSIVIYSTSSSFLALQIATVFTLLSLLLYNLIVIYAYRKLLIPTVFYFILYLCALETSPYLLLYKYFKL
ncbi:DUF4271 domain-containing protein [Nonlabens dokdonensis]|nr:DUF4271 domain-containing protein [Nonlabens dokdonensis]